MLDTDPETAVLGCVLVTGGRCIDDLDLTGEDFAEVRRGDLYDEMVRMWASGTPVDAFTLSEARPEEADFLFGLTSGPWTASSSTFYADIVRTRSLRRRLSLVNLNMIPGDDPSLIADQARQLVDTALGDTGNRVRYVKDILPGLIERMNEKHQFIPSPWPSLNARIGGFRPGAVYVVAARPGIGKTVVAAQVAARLAADGHVAFASMEMSGEELVARMVSERLQINVGRIKDGHMTELDWKALADGRSRLDDLRIAIDDRAGVTATDVRAFARSVARKGHLSGVVVDYMQLMTSKLKQDRHVQVAEFSRQLKILAKDFKVPVIALSQLNRNSETSSMAVPKLSDLRESGAIEQDADVVILLRREGEYPYEDLILDVAKNRHGETGDVRLSWDGVYSRALDKGAP